MNTTSIHNIYNDFYISSFTESLTFDDIKFPANESLNSIISFIKIIYRKTIEYIKKFIQWLKDLFKKAIKYIRKLINYLLESDFKHRVIAKETFINGDIDIRKNIKNLLDFINNKKLTIVKFSELFLLIKLVYSFINNYSNILVKMKTILDSNIVLNKSLLGICVDNNIIEIDKRIDNKTQQYLLGNSRTFGDTVSGYQIFEYNDIEIDLSSITSKNIDSVFYNLLKQINEKIKYIDDYIVPRLDELFKYCNQKDRTGITELEQTLGTKITKQLVRNENSRQELTNLYITMGNLVKSTISSVSIILSSNIDQTTNFFSEFIIRFRKEVQNIVELKKVEINIKQPQFIQELLNKIHPICKINSINCYKTSDFRNILNKFNINITNLSNSYCLYIPYGITHFILIGDNLLKILNKNELNFTIAHEYGHYTKRHNVTNEIENISQAIKNAKIEQNNRSTQEELEADIIAAEICGLDESLAALISIKRKLSVYSSEINTRIKHLQELKNKY